MPAVVSLAHSQQGAPYEEPLDESHADFVKHVPAAEVDKKDTDTPDKWIPRDPRILRLTGRHPLNCEPNPTDLLKYGFVTPPSIHFVRNHGSVPKMDWSTHRLEVNGLVDKPFSLSMDELVALPSVTVPVTLVCAGNRRKEMNMIKKSVGFNWGASATSTTYWTGVRLSDLMKKAGIKTPAQGANFVCFKGPGGELPKGDDGSYGTSVTYHKAMDPANDILIAYKCNDRWLTPDHGFPCRMIIPGHIGGRMVKWLCELTVTEKESDNYYHYFDNRVLPVHVDEALAMSEGWWYKPDYIINDLNINSAVVYPGNDEVVPLEVDTMYKARGYAYSGGGRKIIRVEISLDDGVSWRACNIQRHFPPTEYGKYWAWIHWELEIPVFDMLGPKELLLRAWDESMNTQPAVITWTLMGMLNNCFHRIKIHPHKEKDGKMGLRFQHPAPLEVGQHGNVGWREEDNLRNQALTAGYAALAPGAPPPKTDVTAAVAANVKTFTMDEVAQHTEEDSVWFVHEGKVYDGTPFLADHPGGAESILIVGGADATEDFNAIHSTKAKNMLKDYYLGDLVETKADVVPPPVAPPVKDAVVAPPATKVDDLCTLNPRQKISLPMIERIEVSHNTRIYRFALPSDKHYLGLPCGKHVFLYATIGGETVMRAYTPISNDDDLGRLDLLIKVYRKDQHPSFPAGGKMSQYLDDLKVGDCITVKGPVGHFVYEGHGQYRMNKLKGTHRVARHFSMLAGGTGITPVYQVIKAVLKDPKDPTTMSLLYANQTEEDILLKAELDALAAAHPTKFKIFYIVSQPKTADWPHGRGYMTEAMMRERLFKCSVDSDEHTLGLMCGPPGLLNNVCIPGLTAMGYSEDEIVNF
eukprot:gene21626-28630_t